jgi:D-glycero-D-manno-heptose 1,7-bisphosphate phosphatase
MKLVILDRDGVINQDSDDYIKSAAEWVPLPGALEAIARLTNAGFAVAVATNQSGIARGLFDVDTLQLIHRTLYARAAALGGRIDAIAFCPHGPDDNCGCRKPKPGLLREIAQRFATTLDGVPVIGDSLRDLQAARSVGAWPILVRTGKGAETAANLPAGLGDVPIAADLAGAADLVLSGPRRRQ